MHAAVMWGLTQTPGLEHAAQLLLEVADLVAQARSDLELQLGGGGSHLLAELLDQVGELTRRQVGEVGGV